MQGRPACSRRWARPVRRRGACLRERFNQRGQELEQRSRELAAEPARFDVIQQPALERIEALTATVAEQREAPTAAPEAPGATEAPTEVDSRSVVGANVAVGGRHVKQPDLVFTSMALALVSGLLVVNMIRGDAARGW